MNQDQFVQWAAKKGIAAQRARAILSAAVSAASSYPRTSPTYWTTVRQHIKANIGAAPNPKAEAAASTLSGLATHLRRGPGSTGLIEENDRLWLSYHRDSSNGIAYPFTDYCDLHSSFDLKTNTWDTSGIVYGVNVKSVKTNEPGVFFMTSLGQAEQYNAIVRDFLTRALLIAERYGSQNMNLFAFKLQTELRNLGTMKFLDPSKAPLTAEFTAAEVPFTAYFSKSALGLPLIKFNPAPGTAGYQVSTRTFQQLLLALDKHVEDHMEFVQACIAATNQLPG